MNSVYAIIVFLCVQELTAASFYRLPKRYYQYPRQERKQANNVSVKNPARTPAFLPEPQKSAKIISEEIVTINTKLNEADLNEDQPILKPCQPVLRQELSIMTTLPILTILPIVASLPIVNVGRKVADELASLDEFDPPEESLDFEEIGEVEESTVSVNILQEVTYEIVERKPKKSPILHKMRRIEEFKRNILQRDKSPNSDFY